MLNIIHNGPTHFFLLPQLNAKYTDDMIPIGYDFRHTFIQARLCKIDMCLDMIFAW